MTIPAQFVCAMGEKERKMLYSVCVFLTYSQRGMLSCSQFYSQLVLFLLSTYTGSTRGCSVLCCSVVVSLVLSGAKCHRVGTYALVYTLYMY